MNQPDPTTDPETARLHEEILTGRAEIAQLRDLLRKENQRANDAIERETTAEEADLEAQQEHGEVIARVEHLALAFEVSGNEFIAERIRAAVTGTEPVAVPSAPTDRRDRIRRVLAEADAFSFDGLEPHDYQRHATAVLAVADAEQAELRTQNARMRHELEVMYGGAFDTLAAAPTAPTVWVDGHPRLEAIALAVWEKCQRSTSCFCVDDDPRNIAVAAYAAVLNSVPPTTQAADEPDDTDLTESDIDRMMVAGVPVQIVAGPPGTFAVDPAAPSLEFHAYGDAPAAPVVPPAPTSRAALYAEVADECDTAGAAYAARAQNDHAAGAFALMETFLRKANEAEYVATPCSVGGCEPGGEPCSTHERLMAHGEGDHELCAPDCDVRSRLATETAQAEPLRAELKPWQLLRAEPDGPLPQTERLAGGRRLGTGVQRHVDVHRAAHDPSGLAAVPAAEEQPDAEPAGPDNPAAYALARHIAGYPMSTVQAAFRYLNSPMVIELVAAEEQPDNETPGQLAATTCSAQHRTLDDGRLCIRAAQHPGDHIDERGFHWSDTVAVYPVSDGTFRIGTDVRAAHRAAAAPPAVVPQPEEA